MKQNLRALVFWGGIFLACGLLGGKTAVGIAAIGLVLVQVL